MGKKRHPLHTFLISFFFFSYFTRNRILLIHYLLLTVNNNDNYKQLSPEGEVNSGLRREASRYYIHHSSPTLRRIVVLVFTKSDGQKNAVLINDHNLFFKNFQETTCHFSLRLQNSEYPRIFQVTGANQNARKLLSTDLVNTNVFY